MGESSTPQVTPPGPWTIVVAKPSVRTRALGGTSGSAFTGTASCADLGTTPSVPLAPGWTRTHVLGIAAAIVDLPPSPADALCC